MLRLRRNDTEKLACDEKLFFKVVKQAFATRRKTLRNAVKPFGMSAEHTADPIFDKRAEQLSVADFVWLTNYVEQHRVIAPVAPPKAKRKKEWRHGRGGVGAGWPSWIIGLL